mmetsp:Transcript_25191/g.54562  ORF Transcript_25191/g.54562 Transcript_25191/m.54562 type:complete len:235 (-) Transcript_25191:342-1046(-)
MIVGTSRHGTPDRCTTPTPAGSCHDMIETSLGVRMTAHLVLDRVVVRGGEDRTRQRRGRIVTGGRIVHYLEFFFFVFLFCILSGALRTALPAVLGGFFAQTSTHLLDEGLVGHFIVVAIGAIGSGGRGSPTTVLNVLQDEILVVDGDGPFLSTITTSTGHILVLPIELGVGNSGPIHADIIPNLPHGPNEGIDVALTPDIVGGELFEMRTLSFEEGCHLVGVLGGGGGGAVTPP